MKGRSMIKCWRVCERWLKGLELAAFKYPAVELFFLF